MGRKKKFISHEEYMENAPVEWRTVVINGGLCCKYEISNKGDIRKIKNKKKISQSTSNKGYCSVTLIYDGIRKKYFVHRLIAMTFLKIPKSLKKEGYSENNLQVNHKDGVKSHNSIVNLEWCTPRENIDHAVENELELKGEDHPNATISDEMANLICKYLRFGCGCKAIAEHVGVSEYVVRNIRSKKTWKHISDKWNIKESDNTPFSVTDEDLHKICQEIMNGISGKAIAKRFNVSTGYVSMVKDYKIRPDITRQYDFSKRKGIPKRQDKEFCEKVCKEIVEGRLKLQEIAYNNGISASFISELKSCKICPEISEKYFKKI